MDLYDEVLKVRHQSFLRNLLFITLIIRVTKDKYPLELTVVGFPPAPRPFQKPNINGGACALCHPVGATGGLLIVTLLHAMQANNLGLDIGSLCIG